jgi:hypothetical protein
MARLLRSAPIGALAALALGACVTATAVPAAAQGIAGSWPQGGQSIAGSWPQGGQSIAGSWPQGGQSIAGSWPKGGEAAARIAGGRSAFAPNNNRGCYWQNWPNYDIEGNFAGYQPVQVCN